MPLTKAEFDRLMAERKNLLEQVEEREKALKRSPECGVGRITSNGSLVIYGGPNALAPDYTRSLYEMLKSWYGEATMTEKAQAVIRVAGEYRDFLAFNPAYQFSASERAVVDVVDAYRAEIAR